MRCPVCSAPVTKQYVLEEKPLYVYCVCGDSQCRALVHQFLTNHFWYGDVDSERWAQLYPTMRAGIRIATAAQRTDLVDRVDEIENILKTADMPACRPLPEGVTLGSLLCRWKSENTNPASLSDIFSYIP